MKPLLAHVFEPKRWDGTTPCWIQPKLNGVRALYQNGTFQSREELPWNPKVLKHLSDPLREMFPDERIILDGELYVHGWSLQRINGAVQIARTEPREDTTLVEYWVFDRVSYELPFAIRFGTVDNTIRDLQHPMINAVTTVNVQSKPEWVEDFYARIVSEGFEGIMYRLGNCPYTTPKQSNGNRYGSHNPRFLSDKNNRVWHLLKRKSWMDEEFECLRIEEGIGKREGMVGAFVCFNDGMQKEFRVGSGLTDSEALFYFNNPPIGRKIKVKFLCYTADGIPFNPTVEAIL